MTTQSSSKASEKLRVRATVSVDGRRWRRLPRVEALWRATQDDRVYVLDPETGAVRFGDGVRGAQPRVGALVRVWYRQSAGAAGNVAAAWVGSWPPHPFPLADALVPCVLTNRCS